MTSFISKKMLNKHLLVYSLFFLTLISFFIGFEFRENSAGGGIIDLKHEWHNYNLLKNDKLSFLYGNYEASRFPLFHIINIYINPFINSQPDFILSFFLYSLILIVIFYFSLKTTFRDNHVIIFLFLSILLLSPYFRTSSFWGLQENLAYIFFLLSFLIFEKNRNYVFLILFVSFLSFYSDQKFIFLPLIFLLSLFDKNKIFCSNNKKLLLYSTILSIPGIVIFYIWGGITKSETTSGINELSFRPQNIIYTINIMAVYFFPFLVFAKKKVFINFFKKIKIIYILSFIIVYIVIRYYFIDIALPISGGWSFKIFRFFFNINIALSEIIFFFISLFSYLLVLFYLKEIIKSFINKILVLFLIFFPLSMEIVFQEYFDPLMFFIIIFFIHKNDIKTANISKGLPIFVYFLIFWISSLSYYLYI